MREGGGGAYYLIGCYTEVRKTPDEVTDQAFIKKNLTLNRTKCETFSYIKNGETISAMRQKRRERERELCTSPQSSNGVENCCAAKGAGAVKKRRN